MMAALRPWPIQVGMAVQGVTRTLQGHDNKTRSALIRSLRPQIWAVKDQALHQMLGQTKDRLPEEP